MPGYRLKKLGGAAAAMGADSFLVTNLTNVHYLTGFTGSSGYVLFARDKAYFITDFRYKSQSADEVKGCEIVIQKGRWTEDVASLAASLGVKRLAFESRSVSFETHAALMDALPGIELVASKDTVEKIRIVKDDDEIKKIAESERWGSRWRNC